MNYNLPRERCACCVMPVTEGRVMLDENGVCNACACCGEMDATRKASANAGGFDQESPERKLAVFQKKVRKYKDPGNKYDCAVAVSGGKDSIMTLYIAKKVAGLNPLAIFVDNGFALDEMYDNVRNATEILGCDLIIYKTSDLINFFELLLKSKRRIYYCRVCHALLDLKINEICAQNNIRLVLGGYTKGQQYIRNSELFSIYDESDANTIDLIRTDHRFQQYVELYQNQNAYFRKYFPQIAHLSPFKYIEWNEDEILATIGRELRFKLPARSWPSKSSNCTFNYVAQLLAIKQFGFAQHETELSDLVRKGELTRARALEIIQTPIEDQDLRDPLEKVHMTIEEILNDNE